MWKADSRRFYEMDAFGRRVTQPKTLYSSRKPAPSRIGSFESLYRKRRCADAVRSLYGVPELYGHERGNSSGLPRTSPARMQIQGFSVMMGAKMARKSVPKETENEVLAKCRRRCCICFGLERNIEIKRGQIAHLDDDPANNSLENLAFLCFDHHDEFDTSTSQSKGLTVGEVKKYRRELCAVIDEAWKQPVSFGDQDVAPQDDQISGHYVREGDFEEAELDVTLLPGNRVRVEGFALWGTTRPSGPNIGDIDFESTVESGSAVYREERTGDKEYELELEFGEGKIEAIEKGSVGGMNVTFEGEYRRVQSSSSHST